MSLGHRISKYFLRLCYSHVVRTAFYEKPPKDQRCARQLKNVLVIRTDGLGDIVLDTALFRHIKRAFGGPRVVLITRQEWKDIFQACPYVDDVIPWNILAYANSLRYRVKFIRSLRSREFDVAVHPVYSREPLSDEVLCCTRAPLKIGFDGDLSNIQAKRKRQNDRCYARFIRNKVAGCTELERNRHFAEQLIDREIRSDEFQPELWLTDADRSAAEDLLLQSGIDVGRAALIALFPGASSTYKTWRPENYADLARRMLQHFDLRFVIFGTSAEADLASAIAGKINGPVVNLAGKTSLTQLAAVLECSDLFIGNDTGPLHVAAAVGAPTLGIMGGGHFGRFYPYGDLNRHRMVFKKMDCYGCNWKCIYETTRCIQGITVDDVWREAQRMMEEVVLPSRAARDAKRQGKMVLST